MGDKGQGNTTAAAVFKDVANLIADFENWAGGTWTGCVQALEGHEDIDDPEALCSWLHYQALGKWPGEKAADGQEPEPPGTQRDTKTDEEPELTGPIVQKNAARRIAYAAVLVPGEIDADGESVTAEKTEQAAHEWMERYQNVDLQHTLNNIGVPVESYLTPQEMTVKAIDGEAMTLPAGTWILGSRLDESTWDAVEKNQLTGYSIMGMKRTAMKTFQETAAAGKSTDGPTITAALKKTLLRDLGEDWVPVYVSVVQRPAVPKAKFFALKAQEPENQEEGATIVDKIKAKFTKTSTKNTNAAEKEGRRFAKDTVEKLKAAAAAIQALVEEAESEESARQKQASIPGQKGGDQEMTDEEIKELVQSAVKEEMQQLNERLKALSNEGADQDQDADQDQEGAEKSGQDQDTDQDQDAGQDGGSEKDTDQDQEPSELDAFKAEVMEKLEKVSKSSTRSQALKGQDGGDQDGSQKSAEGNARDPFGRRRRKL